MLFINYFFASVISYLGLLIGIILIKIAPEEQKPLKKYFIHFRRILMFIILFLVLFYFINNYLILIILLGLFLILIYFEHKSNDFFIKSFINYSFLGIIFFAVSNNSNLFTLESSLILIYGLPTASLLYKKKNHFKIFYYNLSFLVIANLLFLIFS